MMFRWVTAEMIAFFAARAQREACHNLRSV
jgi:hypothetical protein